MGIVVVPSFGADPVSITGPTLDAKVDGLATEFNGSIDNNNIKSAAGIAYSKLTLTSSILNADISASAGIVDTKLATIATAGTVNITALVATSQAQGDLMYASSATVWSRLGAGTAGKYLRTGGAAANPAWSTNFPVEGYSTGISIIRCTRLVIAAGGTPGTNINVTATDQYNNPTITNGTNIAASGSSGSFAMDAGHQTLTMDITPTIVGVIGATLALHVVNTASTAAADKFFPSVGVSSGNLSITFYKTGSTTTAVMKTAMFPAAGDQVYLDVCYITST